MPHVPLTMPVEYSCHDQSATVRVRCFGRLTIGEIRQYFVDLEAEDTVPFGIVEIVDLSGVEDFSVASHEAHTMPSAYENAHAKHGIRATLLYAPSDMTYGMGRMIQTYFESHLPDHVFEVFRTLDEVESRAGDFRSERS